MWVSQMMAWKCSEQASMEETYQSYHRNLKTHTAPSSVGFKNSLPEEYYGLPKVDSKCIEVTHFFRSDEFVVHDSEKNKQVGT